MVSFIWKERTAQVRNHHATSNLHNVTHCYSYKSEIRTYQLKEEKGRSRWGSLTRYDMKLEDSISNEPL